MRLGFVLAAVLLAAFSAGTYLALRRGINEPCRCFGTSDSPLGPAQLARNLLLGLIALAGAISGRVADSRPAGIAVSLAAAIFLAAVMIFFDDIVYLLRKPS